ncbi:MAG: autoinducer synthesis protein [Alphaproteobacteria bacterium]|nr:autoinducer synthesis protein [Alphaproteobacteria bacterium]
MITCITYKNLSEYGDLLYSSFKLRHECFIERQSYNVNVYQGMEFDQYDTPAAAYLVYHEDRKEALGVNRLTPTSINGMLHDIWPNLVNDKSLLKNSHVWEGTRYCINKSLSSDLRQKIINEMAIAYLEFGLDHQIKKIIGMMPTYIYRSVFEKPGIEMDYLGPIEKIGRHNIRAVAIPVEEKQLYNVRTKTGIWGRILHYTDVNNMESNREYRQVA